MKQNLFFIRLIIVLVFLLQMRSLKAQELRIGGEVSLEVKSLEIGTGLEYRYLSPVDNRQVYLWQSELEYGLRKWLDVGVGYRYATTAEYNSFWNEQLDYDAKNRFTVDMQLKSARFDNGVKLKNRFRYQVSVKDNGKTKPYLRNKFTIDYKLTSLFRPFIEMEMYYNPRDKEIRSIRMYLGTSLEMGSNTIDIVAITEVDMSEYVNVKYVLGLSYSFDL